MRNLNIDSNIVCLYQDEDLRPSAKRQTTDALYENGIYQIWSFCRKTKSELKAIDGIDEEVLSIIVTKLHEAGFFLGMTKQDLEEIEDAEYLRRHPERYKAVVTEDNEGHEKSIPFDKPFDVSTLSKILREQRDIEAIGAVKNDDSSQKKVPLTSSLRRKLLDKCEKSSRDMINRMIEERGLMRMRPEDFDCIRFSLFRMYFFHQPWYVRLLYNSKERMLRAKWQSEKLFDAYMKLFVDEMVEAYIRTYEQELETNWDSNWNRYLTDLDN